MNPELRTFIELIDDRHPPFGARRRLWRFCADSSDRRGRSGRTSSQLVDGLLNEGTVGRRSDLLHALFVGLSIIELATNRPKGKARSKAALKLAFKAIAGEQ
jgi:hypothetical protein